ncbi:MAG TPA: hypothetical protein VK081_00970, partial [Planctomycetota bacterium]|nr:hypothetical protein [Planctomycetota bacterium]
MSFAPERLHQTVLAIAGELRHDPGLAAEMLRAERQFFGGLPDYAPEGPARASAQARFAEWFVLERESEHLGAVPIEAFGGISEPVRDALRATACGLFLVESVEPELRVRDVLRGEAFELETDATLRVGDVVVGRVYPGATDAVAPSPAAAILRDGGAVVAALQRDLRRAGIERQLTQAEI